VNGAVDVLRLPVAAIVFREDLYPRIESKTSAVLVQKYAEDVDVLPPIEVNQDHELIDGWHRWTAHKKVKADMIGVTITSTSSDLELLKLAARRNNNHGHQLSQDDKRALARRLYQGAADKDRASLKKELEGLLSVSERTVREWLSRIDKDAKGARDRRIFDLWLACWTHEEIADEIGIEKQRVGEVICPDPANRPKADKAAADHATDFEPPIYNIWKQQEKTGGSGHFGNSEVRWLDNLLYLYTQPFDIVVDPFAGGGSTIDLCRRRLRRYFVSDRVPIVEREKEIRRHDLVTDGLPKPPNWKDVRLVYLDPPYWKQAAGKYSTDASDLANMSLDDFNASLSGLIAAFGKKLTEGHIALIIQPTQWNAPEHAFTDHVGDMLRRVKLPVAMRYSVPYESQQCNAQMVEWAKASKTTLVLTREIVVWKVA